MNPIIRNIIKVVLGLLIFIAMFFTAKVGFTATTHFMWEFYESLFGLELIVFLALLLML